MGNGTDSEIAQFVYFLNIIYSFMIPLSAIGSVLNILNIVAIVLAKLHKKTAFKLVSSLAVSDFLIDQGLILMAASYFARISLSTQWPVITLFSQTLFTLGGMTCIGTLVLISFDLLLKTCFPLKYASLQRYCTIFLAITWILTFAVGPVLRTLISIIGKKEHQTFTVAYIHGGQYLIWIHLGFALIGSLVLLILNLIIYFKIRGMKSRLQHNTIDTRKSAITLFLVVSTFFFFNVPHYLLTSITYFDTALGTDISLMYIAVSCILFLSLNTIADPMIYAFRIAAIHEIFTNCLKKFRRR